MTKKQSNPMWGGHFDASASELLEKINSSISFDKKLYEEDITASIAHCKMLAKQQIITDTEAKKIIDGLEQVKTEIESGKFEFKEELEDIHMNIEFRLKEIIGDVAGKLHTGRSRNDQVATDFKLFVRNSYDHLEKELKKLIANLISKAEDNIETYMPGFTHLQPAQPISFAHHLHAYVEMFLRDLERISSSRTHLNHSPLGSAALAGTSFPIDRDATSSALGFTSPTRNSLDSVSDRDFALEFLSNASICMVHMSRFAEEIIIWMNNGFGFIKLSDSYTTGSSIMPQKRNPDAAELVRGKSGRVIGNLVALLTTMKALPLAYSKDMQEDKEPVFDSFETWNIAVKVLSGMIADMTVNKSNMAKHTKHGFQTATDLADFLVKNINMPFRNAHHVTGKIVKIAESKNCQLNEISLTEMQEICPEITEDIYSVLSVENSVNSRNSFGGTSPQQVKKALAIAKKKLK